MISFCNAKINIGLNIIEKRDDGYHNIESVFYPVAWNDILEIIPGNPLVPSELNYSGIDIPGAISNNLILRAYDLIKQDHSLPNMNVHLHKSIPIGAGLGGGSSDGAAAIKLLNRIFELYLSNEKMMHYSAQLGSDCSFFILNEPAIARGKGEKLSLINLSLNSYSICIVYPNIHVSTADAYSGIVPKRRETDISELIKQPIQTWKDSIVNDFEETIFPKYPRIRELKEFMYQNGALYSSKRRDRVADRFWFTSQFYLYPFYAGIYHFCN